MYVLLMNMSVFPPNGIAECRCRVGQNLRDELSGRYGKTDPACFEYSYYGQMEPVPMLMMNMLRGTGEKLDEIVFLNTRETADESELKLPDQTTEKISPDEYFTRQITEYAKKTEMQPPTFTKLYDAEWKGATEKEEALKKITKAVERIRKLKQEALETGEPFHLWYDNHGGVRNTTITSLSILNVLKEENISPDYSLFVQFDNKSKRDPIKTYHVFQDTISADILEFTNVIQSFLLYGRSESLMRYRESHPDEIGSTGDRLLEQIRNISDAISLCDIVLFEKSLAEIRKLLDSNENHYDGLLEIFRTNIQASYGDLLQEGSTIIDEIEWCVRKGFYQQAVSIIEARMPEYLYDHFFEDCSVYYTGGDSFRRPDWGEEKEKAVFEILKENRVWESLKTRLYSKWADANFLVTCFRPKNGHRAEQLEEILYGSLNPDKDPIMKECAADVASCTDSPEELVKYTNPLILSGEKDRGFHLPMNSVLVSKGKSYYFRNGYEGDVLLAFGKGKDREETNAVHIRFKLKIPEYTENSENWCICLHKQLYLHHLLVAERNNIMHASLQSEERRSPGEIQEMLRDYVRWIRKLE